MTESLRILILEDNPADAELVQFELQEAGIIFTAKVVMTEKDFIHEIQEFCPNLILSDYDLPKYNGAIALAEAKRRCPDTPFILVTGAVTEDRAIDILTQGAKDYVLKTRLEQRLVPAVRRALGEAEEHRARKQAEAELLESHRTLEEKVKIRTAELEAEMTARKKAEEVLQDSEKRYRRLFEAAKDGILILDANTGKVVDVNPFLLQLLGYSYDELYGQHIWELGVFKDIAASKQAFKALQDNEYIRYDDLPLETRTGQSIDVEFISNVYSVDHSRVVQCNIRDITERKRAEAGRHEALAKAAEGERILKTLMEYVPEGITIADVPDVRIRMVSRYGREMLGGVHDRMTADEVADQWKVYEKDGTTPIMASDLPLSRAMLKGETILNEELVQVNTQGRALPLLCNAAPIRDDSGRITGGIVAWRDITKLKQVEEELEQHRRNLEEMVHERTVALRRSQELLNETQRISKVGGWEFDVSTRRVFWTDEVYRIHGLTKDYNPSNPEQDIKFYAPEDQKRITDAFQRAVAQGEPYDLELQLLPANGGSLRVRTMGRAEKRDGKVVRVFGNILDITEMMKAQTALHDLNVTLEEQVAERTEELRQSEQRFRLALRNSPVSVAVQNHDLVYTWAYNQRTRRPDEIAGKTDADLFEPEDVNWIIEEKRKVLESGTEVHVQHWVTSNGKRFFLDLYYEPLRNSAGMITGIGIAVVDITEQKLVEAALREREATLRGILDAAKESIWLFHADGRVLLANTTALQRFGKPENEVIGKHTRDILTPALAKARLLRYQQVIDSGQPLEFEDDRDGIQFHHSFYPVFDAQGCVTAIACFSRDITGHKTANEALRASDEQFRVLIQNLQSAIALIDEQGTFRIVNNSFLRVFEIPQDATILNVNNRDWAQWQVFDERGVLLEVDEHPVRKAVLTHAAVKNQLVAVKSPASPDLKWLLVSAEPILKKAGGIHQIICTYYDITERRTAEEALRESKERFKSVLDNSQDISYRIDLRSNRYIYMSPATRTMLGMEPEEFADMSNEDVLARVHPDDLPVLRAEMARLPVTGRGYCEYRFRGAAGEYRWWANQMVIFSDSEGKPLYRDGSVRDITEKRQAEEALKKKTQQLEDANCELESFSYSVSHDLKAPLRAIEGYSRMFMKKYGNTLDEDASRLLNLIRSNTEMMTRLTDELLAFSSVLKSDMTTSEIDMEKLVKDVWNGIRETNAERELELRMGKITPGFGDPTLIRQVLTNLVANAVKFTKGRKPGIIEISSYRDNGNVVYNIKDNGTGFDMSYYDKLFGAFQRLHAHEEYEGTGVGLAIVHRIIKRHGGRVWAEAKVDKGATFYFTLPTPRK